MTFIIFASLLSFFSGFADSFSSFSNYYSYAFDVSPYGEEISFLNTLTHISQILAAVFAIFLFKKVHPKQTVRICLVSILISHILTSLSQNIFLFIIGVCLIQFFATMLYISAIVFVIVKARANREHLNRRLLAALLPIAVTYILGEIVNDILRTIFEFVLPNSQNVDFGWRLLFALPIILVLVLLVASFKVKKASWQIQEDCASFQTTAQTQQPPNSFTMTNRRQAIIATLMIIALMNFQGQNLIFNVLPQILKETSWTSETTNFYSIGEDILALFSVAFVFLLLRKFHAKTILVFSSGAVALLMLSAVIFVIADNGDIMKSPLVFILAQVFVVLIAIFSNLSTWFIPLIIVLRHTQNPRLTFILSLTVIAEAVAQIISDFSGIGLYTIPSAIAAFVVLLISAFIMPARFDND